jgi:hypothetical protein
MRREEMRWEEKRRDAKTWERSEGIPKEKRREETRRDDKSWVEKRRQEKRSEEIPR